MKLKAIIPLLLLAGCCTVSSQTTNAVTNTNTPSMLTKEQANLLAIRLANKTHLVVKGFPDALFRFDTNAVPLSDSINTNNTPLTQRRESMEATFIRTRFIDGHWIVELFCFPHERVLYTATVELAPDGSTNAVSVQHHRGL
jgi:hypothetical protein